MLLRIGVKSSIGKSTRVTFTVYSYSQSWHTICLESGE